MTVANVHCDVEQLLVGWIPTVVTARAMTEVTAKLAENLPVVRVVRIGGPNGAPGFDYPNVAIDCFAATRPAAKALAYELNSALLYQLPGFSNRYGTVLTAKTLSGLVALPYENANIRSFTSTYQFAVHAR